MGMSTHVTGFKPPDATWRKMKDIYDACKAGGVKVPAEVERFFDGERPDDSGVKVDLEAAGCVRPFHGNSQEGFEVDVMKMQAMHPDIKTVRFYNAW